jgi:hypothetical protein
MSRNTVRPDEDAHAKVQQLLPWLLTDTLEGAELAMVREHLHGCEACRAELAWERNVRAAGQCTPALDADQALAKLLPRLKPRQASTGLVERLRDRFAANDRNWLRALAAAQFALIAALALLLVPPARDDAAYRTLGAALSDQGSMVVTFKPDTPERELRRILQANDARVVDGPTVTDAYVLAVPAPHAAAALARLRAEPSVQLAEPLTPARQP